MAFMPRATHVLQWGVQSVYGNIHVIDKTPLSSDWGLQLDPMKSESLVIANQHVAVNMFSDFVLTAHQAMKVGKI